MLRLRQICLIAGQLAPVVKDLKNVLGLETCFHDPAVGAYGLENALLPIGTNFLEVVAPIEENTAGGRYLERRGGDGGYMVILQCDDVEERRTRMSDLNVRIANALNYDDFTGIQLHPRDTGGCMLETDTMEGDQSSDGPWHPAGNNWKIAVRTERTASMVGAELQSPKPGALAERWGEILNRPLSRVVDGLPELILDNATLRFIEATDGRGEGLAGIDIHATDPAAILETADSRGLSVNGNSINICGTRFYLA